MVAAVVIDTEWGFRDGRLDCESAWEPVVLCARLLPSNRDYSFWGRDNRLNSFVRDHCNHVFVAHAATAEMKYLLRLGVELPERWFCTMTGFRAACNKPGFINGSLLSALAATGLGHLTPANKEEIRNRILHLKFDAANAADAALIADYCRADVIATAALYDHLVGKVDSVAMNYWSEYLNAVARMELCGIPIDTDQLRTILRHRQHIRDAFTDRANQTATVYRADGSFNSKAFFRWVSRQGITWPRKWSDCRRRHYRALDDDTMKMMELRHPFVAEIRQCRKTIRTLSKLKIKVDGRTHRHYFSTMPFRSVTGRNQPSRFVFGGPKWIRWLVVPPTTDHVLIYVDFSAQEIGIAAALSGDMAMRAMYGSADPHMAFAIMAAAPPPDATKATHPQIRAAYKTVNLAVLYSQPERGISERLGISVDNAQSILNQHRALFHVFHAWSDRVVSASFDRGYAATPCGWRAKVEPESKWRTWSNFPIQGGGADIMRVMTIALDRQHVETLAIVHDGWLLTCRRGEQEHLRSAVEQARAFACEKVLGGYQLKIDWTEYGERFEDEEGRSAWEFIQSVLPKERLYVPAE